jgi:CHAD domain-containing protein
MPTASRTAIESEPVDPDAPTCGGLRALDAHAGPAAAPLRPKRRPRRPGVLPADPLAEAGRKILRLHFEEMLAHEAGTRTGEDPEALHDMRVATRRQRAALRLVAPHFRRAAIRPVRGGLRALGGVLGAVRDLDVLLARASADRSTLPAAEAGVPEILVDCWRRRRDAARAQMRAHLDEPAYLEFREEYARFLDTPGAGARIAAPGEPPRPTLVAHVVPAEIWTRYAAVCAFGTVLPWASVEMLHALRIEAKGLRYLLEFFREVLDPCVEDAIGAIVAVQDHLGELQDAVVAIGLVRDFLAGPEAAASPGIAAAAGRYLESRQAAIEALRRSVDRPWSAVSGAAFRSCLARAAAAP